jgi:hypothetical protein
LHKSSPPLYGGSAYAINETNAKFWVDTQGGVHLKGTLHGADGTFSGALQAASGTFSGSLQAATGSFTGTVTATDFRFKDGNTVKTLLDQSTKQIGADFLNLKGLTISNGSKVTFKIDGNGNVTLANGSIQWDSVNSDPKIDTALNAASSAASDAYDAMDTAKKLANGKYSGGTFISNKEIYSPTIKSVEVIGGKITGVLMQGGEFRVDGSITSSSITRSEIGIYNGSDNKYGYIRYDDQGSGNNEARERMFIGTTRSRPLKIYSDSDMSIGTAANKTIYIASNTHFMGDVTGIVARFA